MLYQLQHFQYQNKHFPYIHSACIVLFFTCIHLKRRVSMQQINRAFNEIFASSYDKPLNLEALGPWSKSIATELATKEGITLTPAHWEVIEAIRNHYQEFGLEANARSLLKRMEVEFAEPGGKQYLYDLFPHGPVNQACRIAGLPLPPHSTDPSFGSVM